MSDVAIRDAESTDAPALSGLLAELGFPATPDTIVARLSAMYDGGEVVLVAARGDDVVGLVTVHVTPVLHRPTAVGRLTALVVTDRERGRGAGRALVAAAERRLAERGCGLVEVTSNNRLVEAHTFYQRLGYEATSTRFKKTLSPGAAVP